MKSTISTLEKGRYRRDVSKVYRDVNVSNVRDVIRDVRDFIGDVILTPRDIKRFKN